MIRECMDMHGKHRGDMPFHSGGNERLYHAAWPTVATMDKNPASPAGFLLAGPYRERSKPN